MLEPASRAEGALLRADRSVGPGERLVLGSASPRRRDLLASLGLPFRMLPGHAEECLLPGESALSFLQRVTQDKLAAVRSRCAAELAVPPPAILVADTIVVLGDSILGKPSGVQQAAESLRRLCGRTHRVMTRYLVAEAEAGGGCYAARTVVSEVEMRSATESEVLRYASSGEGLDKAGAYAVQGLGAFLVEGIRGSYTNVVGLPACELVSDLLACGLLAAFPIAPAPAA